MLLNQGFNAIGKVCLIGAEIGGNLDCSGGRFRRGNQSDTPALDLEQASVEKTLYLFGLIPDGSLDLSFAHAHVLSDDRESWPLPGALNLDGFVYDEIDATRSPTDVQSRHTWLSLERTPYFARQPYEQLAKVVNGMGYSDDAKDVSIAEHKAIRKDGNLGIAGWLWNWSFYWLVGYGYRVWYSLIWAAVAVSTGAASFTDAANRKVLVRNMFLPKSRITRLSSLILRRAMGGGHVLASSNNSSPISFTR